MPITITDRYAYIRGWSSEGASELLATQKTNGWTKQMGKGNRDEADVRTLHLMRPRSLQLLAGSVHLCCLLNDCSALRTHNEYVQFWHSERYRRGDHAGITRWGQVSSGVGGHGLPQGQGLGERGTAWGFPALGWRKEARRKCWLSQAVWQDSQKRSQYHRHLEASEVVFNSWLQQLDLPALPTVSLHTSRDSSELSPAHYRLARGRLSFKWKPNIGTQVKSTS